ncbi:MAG: LysR family transcriptional regulator [Burkholderiaceae bacterium]|nr:LysR family transcriptional regulator [Burkholderiaceae bacterium]
MNKPLPSTPALLAFRRVAELRSFKAAAASLGLSGGAVSKLVAQLEAELGVRLLTRSTRHVALSEAGARYLASVGAALDALGEAGASLREQAERVGGRLKVAVPSSFALMWLARRLPDLLVRFPELQVELSLSDQFVDLLEGGHDCALRIATALPSSSLVARRLGSVPRVLVASPAYLRHAPPLRRPQDLLQHNCLLYSLSSTPGIWPLREWRDGQWHELALEVSGSLRANNSVVLREALLAGIGLMLTPLFVVRDLLDSGAVQPLLGDCMPAPHVLYGVMPQARQVPARLRAFLDFVERACAAEPEALIRA